MSTDKKTAGYLNAAIGTAFVVSLSAVPVTQAEANPFQVAELGSGYMVAAMDGKAAEGNCSGKKAGEGNCSGQKAGDKSGAQKAGEGNCSAKKEGSKTKGGEGKCGEGKCASS